MALSFSVYLLCEMEDPNRTITVREQDFTWLIMQLNAVSAEKDRLAAELAKLQSAVNRVSEVCRQMEGIIQKPT